MKSKFAAFAAQQPQKLNVNEEVDENADPDEDEPKTLQELFDDWSTARKYYSWEGERGIKHLTEWVKCLDPHYSDLNHFFSDNSGAIEAIIEWTTGRNLKEWVENVQDASGGMNESLTEAKATKKLKMKVYEFTKVNGYDAFNSKMGLEDEGETSINGFGITYVMKDGNCVGMFYKAKKYGSYCLDFKGDIIDFAERDKNWPDDWN